MKNPYPSTDIENAARRGGYEQARQDAIEAVEGVENPHNIENFNGMRYYAFEGARDKIIAALKAEGGMPGNEPARRAALYPEMLAALKSTYAYLYGLGEHIDSAEYGRLKLEYLIISDLITECEEGENNDTITKP